MLANKFSLTPMFSTGTWAAGLMTAATVVIPLAISIIRETQGQVNLSTLCRISSVELGESLCQCQIKYGPWQS